MLSLSQALLNRPVLSLRTGGQIATTNQPVINPNNLKIEGFYVSDKLSRQTLVLLTQDIREIGENGLIINDHDVLAEVNDLVRLKKTIDFNFILIGKPVQTVSGERIGKVVDFAADSASFYIQKLYVGRSLIKSFSGGSLSVDRTQIQEITNRRIIIADLLKGVPVASPA